jgi:hypothetical protein
MMRDWFSPPKKAAAGWQYRIAFGVIGTWLVAYLMVGSAIFSIGGLVGFGFVVLLGIGGYSLRYFTPRPRNRKSKSN